VGGSHSYSLHVHVASPVHAVAPEDKLLATFLFVVAVVLTPREAFWAFGVYGVLIATVALIARIPPAWLVRRLMFEVPFVAFAVFLPFIGRGPRTDVLGLSLSVEGLWGAWNIVVKGTLGVAATSVLAATTPVAEVLRGLDRLRVPRVLTAIMGFMVRYGEVISGELRRMRVARIARAHDPRWIWQARAVAATAGALFIRSFERGERVHMAMLARGYDGTMPPMLDGEAVPGRRWMVYVVPVVAALVASIAWRLA
jgi:cobalt/nickel transport system permease protein